MLQELALVGHVSAFSRARSKRKLCKAAFYTEHVLTLTSTNWSWAIHFFLLYQSPDLEKNVCSAGPKSGPAVPVDFIFSLKHLTVQLPEEIPVWLHPVGDHFVCLCRSSQEISMQLTALVPLVPLDVLTSCAPYIQAALWKGYPQSKGVFSPYSITCLHNSPPLHQAGGCLAWTSRFITRLVVAMAGSSVSPHLCLSSCLVLDMYLHIYDDLLQWRKLPWPCFCSSPKANSKAQNQTPNKEVKELEPRGSFQLSDTISLH